MDKRLNEAVINEVLKHIPLDKKPAKYLMETLHISKEATYRRLRGEIPFSLEEIFTLSMRINLSLDEFIADRKNNYALFRFVENAELKTRTTFIQFLTFYIDYLDVHTKADRSEIIHTMNNLIHPNFLAFNNLFKFYYFKWVYITGEHPVHYSDIIIPQEIISLCREASDKALQVKKVSFIIDKKIFKNLIEEIQYFYIKGLIKEEELILLKEDLMTHINEAEFIIKNGKDLNYRYMDIYFSVVNIESTTSYSVWDNNEELGLWIYPAYPFVTRDPALCKMHKKWIDSLIKTSTHIQKSNELFLTEFYNKQREYVNTITNTFL